MEEGSCRTPQGDRVLGRCLLNRESEVCQENSERSCSFQSAGRMITEVAVDQVFLVRKLGMAKPARPELAAAGSRSVMVAIDPKATDGS
jgi:hypothetical protein